MVPQVLPTSALVQWRPPFDGNSPILSYQLQYRKLGDKEWSVFKEAIKEVITVIEDLESCSSYRFRVSASNELGQSLMSEATALIETPDPNKSKENVLFFFGHFSTHLCLVIGQIIPDYFNNYAININLLIHDVPKWPDIV